MERRIPNSKRGLTMLEMIATVSIFAVVSVALLSSLGREARALKHFATQSFKESQAGAMLDRVTAELGYAQAVTPRAWMNGETPQHEVDELDVDTLAGFPSAGVLLLQPGTPDEERIAYAELDLDDLSFRTLARGFACGAASDHPSGSLVRWAHSAEAIAEQDAPPPEFFDGITLEPSGPAFYRGDGTGFVFHAPVDPAGNGTFFDLDGNVQWGASVGGVQVIGGFSCFYFAPDSVITEAALDLDVNQDGDLDDSFDRGSIRLRAWDGAAPAAAPRDAALCPPVVLQEVCSWGSDLDADGWQDPIFLWSPDISKLHIRTLILTESSNGQARVRMFERSVFLPNGSIN